MQLRLPCVDPARQIAPARNRSAPAFWIRRVVILESLSWGLESAVRDIQLRRGLNIISTPPQPQGRGNALFRNGIASHTAGKTTFCRMVRYLLGERTFASDSTRRRIRQSFPDGWVLGEVVVGDRLWGVARPFGVGAHPFCCEGATIEQLLNSGERQEHRTFVDALDAVTVANLPARVLPTTEEAIKWDHVLPWLSRDQECRFADVFEWRHSSTGSESPSLSAEERQFVVRSVLGLISDDEREELRRNRLLLARKEDAERRAPLFRHQAASDASRVERLLQMTTNAIPAEFFVAQARGAIARAKLDLGSREVALESEDSPAQAQVTLEQAVEHEAFARRDLGDAEDRWKCEKSGLDELSPGEPSLIAQLPPARDYCNVPMWLARKRGCALAETIPEDLGARRSERSAEEELARARELVGALAANVEAKRAALQDATRVTAQARRAALSAGTAYQERRYALVAEHERLDQIEKLLNEASEASEASESLAAALRSLESDIRESYAKQDAARKKSATAMAHFSRTFEYVVRSLIGEGVAANAELSGRSVSLVVEDRGERESAALETVKLVAFDFAALTEGIQGRGTFPGFLLHDGPRDADLAPDIYERIFLYARRLEECFSSEPAFQYIITTTTPPPHELRTDPWLRETLRGAPSSERLFRRDL